MHVFNLEPRYAKHQRYISTVPTCRIKPHHHPPTHSLHSPCIRPRPSTHWLYFSPYISKRSKRSRIYEIQFNLFLLKFPNIVAKKNTTNVVFKMDGSRCLALNRNTIKTDKQGPFRCLDLGHSGFGTLATAPF